MSQVIENIRQQLINMQDTGYKEFHAGLIPNVNPDTIIGIRTPVLRKYARQAAKEPDIELFLSSLPHKYYEENNLHAFIIENIKEYDRCICAVEEFLPYIDNWATCDSLSPKVFRKHLTELLERIYVWLDSEHEYTVRFGIKLLMSLYLDDAFRPEYIDTVARIQSDKYYVKMMIAWYIATALAKQYDTAINYIEEYRLDIWVHNKAIQKAIESYRINDEQKAYLRTLKKLNNNNANTKK